jgi:hypothetical protein
MSAKTPYRVDSINAAALNRLEGREARVHRRGSTEQFTIGVRSLDFRVDGRTFRMTIDSEEMSGTFTSANGQSERAVGLLSRGMSRGTGVGDHQEKANPPECVVSD